MLALDPHGELESFYADVLKKEADGKEVLLKASAAIPRIYRLKFQRDIYKNLRILEKSIGEAKKTLPNRVGDDYAAVSASVCAARDFYGGYGAFVYWAGE